MNFQHLVAHKHALLIRTLEPGGLSRFLRLPTL